MFLIQTSNCFDLWSKSELKLSTFKDYPTSSFPNVRFSFFFSRPQSESIEFQLPERKPQCLHFPPAQHRLLQPGGQPRGQWSSQEVKLKFVLGLINLRLQYKAILDKHKSKSSSLQECPHFQGCAILIKCNVH
jgi:hypothetical protein